MLIKWGMDNKEYFTITYDGSALDNHEFDVKELAPALIGIADLFEETNKIINGTKAKVQINVRGNFRSGSFPIDFSLAQDILEQFVTLFNTPSVLAASVLLTFLGFDAKDGFKGLIGLIKWLRGRKIKNISRESKEGKITIFLEDNDKIEIDKPVLDLFSSIKVRQSLETVICNPLKRDGIDTFKIKHKDTEIEIKGKESEYFSTPEVQDEIISENTMTKSLQLLTVNFIDGNKWRFSDGNSSFYAEIKDENFVEQIKNGIAAFAIDDIFEVELREIQKLTSGGMKTEVEILKVKKHRSGQRNIQIPLIGDSNN